MQLKPILTVEGKEYEVFSLIVQNGEATTAVIFDENEDCLTYYDADKAFSYIEEKWKLDFSTALKFVGVEEKIASDNEKLIAHLEDMQNEENNKLLEIAIDAMESEPDLPFDSHLSIKQKEYKLMQQRVFGIIDTIEEIKAYMEGYYANVDDEAVEA